MHLKISSVKWQLFFALLLYGKYHEIYPNVEKNTRPDLFLDCSDENVKHNNMFIMTANINDSSCM